MNEYNWEASVVFLPECDIFEIILMAFGDVGPTCIEYACNNIRKHI